MDNDLTIENAIRQAPSASAAAAIAAAADMHRGKRHDGKPLSLAEQSSLNTLRNKMAESSLDRQHVAKQGGERAVAQKAQATAMLNRQNIHGGGSK